jgi:hypothetical protein
MGAFLMNAPHIVVLYILTHMESSPYATLEGDGIVRIES